MKPVTGELPHLIGPARQKRPVFLVGAAGGGIVAEHLRRVVLGVDSNADEPNVLYPDLALDCSQRRNDIGTGFVTAREGEMRDPHDGVELGGAEAAAGLID